MPVVIKLHRSPRHESVGCTVGLAPHVYVGAYGDDAADALHKAAAIAQKLQDTLNAHPEMAAALSLVPGVGQAFMAISVASKALKYGDTAADVAKKYGPQVAHVASKILSLF
jgi:hypothetical protein